MSASTSSWKARAAESRALWQEAVSAGVTGTVRPDLTGASLDGADGYYVNPAAFVAPAPGHWGTAGRNSITGPAQFSLNAGITRSFPN